MLDPVIIEFAEVVREHVKRRASKSCGQRRVELPSELYAIDDPLTEGGEDEDQNDDRPKGYDEDKDQNGADGEIGYADEEMFNEEGDDEID